MRKIPVLTVVILFGLFGCSSQKKLVREAPFTIKDPSCQDYAAGREESGSGFTLILPIADNVGEVTFEEIYFRGHIMKPSVVQNEKGYELVCKHKNESPEEKPDIVMHADPREEIGNQPPSLTKSDQKEFPFELEKDEVVISYREKGKNRLLFYKFKGVKEKPPLLYRSLPKN
ncbi:hypothetical protein [uncultured Muriicola sp.]|uniref:hypothetical protein n=1 Tax=uncultured Muriicola sp. TaxID=1583102 RepID=UPI00260BDD1C|nr:hypothetical protein [uncultured Muriicola sp.]